MFLRFDRRSIREQFYFLVHDDEKVEQFQKTDGVDKQYRDEPPFLAAPCGDPECVAFDSDAPHRENDDKREHKQKGVKGKSGPDAESVKRVHGSNYITRTFGVCVRYTVSMRFLGIDYGSKKIGLALSDEAGVLAFPEAVLVNDAQALARIVELLEGRGVGEVVIGESRTLSGERNPLMEKIDSFVSALARKCDLPIRLEPEFYTSREAQRFNAPEHEDAAAAALILQRYLDKRNTKS